VVGIFFATLYTNSIAWPNRHKCGGTFFEKTTWQININVI
jgi:hypothetical protein